MAWAIRPGPFVTQFPTTSTRQNDAVHCRCGFGRPSVPSAWRRALGRRPDSSRFRVIQMPCGWTAATTLICSNNLDRQRSARHELREHGELDVIAETREHSRFAPQQQRVKEASVAAALGTAGQDGADLIAESQCVVSPSRLTALVRS